MPKRKYLDNTIPSDNTAQIGLGQRYNKRITNTNINADRNIEASVRRYNSGTSKKFINSSNKALRRIGNKDSFVSQRRNPNSHYNWVNKSSGAVKTTSPEFDLLTMLPARYLANAYVNTLVNSTRRLGSDIIIPAAKGGINYIKNNPEKVMQVARMRPFRPITRRAIETAMRTTDAANPIPVIINNFKELKNGWFGGHKRLESIARYILTGTHNKRNPKGWYNSFALPEEDTGFLNYYTGFWQDVPKLGDDYIDALLHKKMIDPKYGLTPIHKGNNFGEYSKYISENYPKQAKDIVTYITNHPAYTPVSIKNVPKKYRFLDAIGTINTQTKYGTYRVNVGGHNILVGDNNVAQASDIFKFLNKDYKKRWNDYIFADNPYYPINISKDLMNRWVDAGLKLINELETPVITRTPWFNNPYMAYKNVLFKNIPMNDPIRKQIIDAQTKYIK